MSLVDRIDRVFAKIDLPDRPGISAAVIRDGQLLFSKGFGCAQLEYEVSITPETRFHVASVSKQFTAFAILILEEAGKLGLDDPIQEHLPWLPELPHPVTVRQLINHTSGIRDQWDLLTMAGWRLDDVITMNDIRALLRSQRELNFVPQERLLYSNSGYTLLAEIVASLSGRSFKEFTRQEIFEPLGMTNTHFHDDHQLVVPGRAYSYELDDSGEWKSAALNFANVGATGLFSTPGDLVLWLDNFRTRILGTDHLFRKLLDVPLLSNGKPASLHNAGYAGGVMIGEYRGQKTVGHDGSDAGFRSSCQWYPEQRAGIVIAANYAECDAAAYQKTLADVVLKGSFKQPRRSLKRPPADPRHTTRSLPCPGRYYLEDVGLATVGTEHNSAILQIPGFRECVMEPVSDDAYFSDTLDGHIKFQKDTEESCCSISIDTRYLETKGFLIPAVTLSESNINSLCGTYFSPELRVFWEVLPSEGHGIRIRHYRHGENRLVPVRQDEKAGIFEFSGENSYATIVIFIRENNQLRMRASSSRAKHVLFEKLSSACPAISGHQGPELRRDIPEPG